MTRRHDPDGPTRRALLGAAATLGAAALGGCLTLSPGIDAAGLADSAVFESLTVREPWGSNRVAVKVRLTPSATTDLGVRGLSVISSSGSKFDAQTVASGQTTQTLFFPPEGRSTLAATDYDGQTVETLRVTVTGRRVP